MARARYYVVKHPWFSGRGEAQRSVRRVRRGAAIHEALNCAGLNAALGAVVPINAAERRRLMRLRDCRPCERCRGMR